ncbi:MAG: TlpA family protein disulfide reductase [Gammaproteobacteria bacterium]|nr:TlpA family protein disulfide reductase [Gammaproteobacteria bacterium]
MFKSFTSLLLSLLIIIPTIVVAQTSKIQKAPDIKLIFSDKSAMLSDYNGQVVYLDFWASWCKPCRRSFPWMNDIQARLGSKGLKVIAINLDAERELAQEFLKQVQVNLDVAYDHTGAIAEIYNVESMPSSYLIDRKGNLRSRHRGFFVKKQNKYEQEIRNLLAEKD